jgi:cytochrome c biogenesis protein CcmG, thiol:disulfide interchange protein DsbE
MPTAASDPGSRRERPAASRGQAIVGLAIAVLIVAAAWFAGARSGWDSIGRGGGYQSVLPKVGDVAPDFETQDVFGNPVRLSDFAGDPVWLMFWGSWCPPCRAEFPDIQAAYEQVAPKGVRMLGVSLRESALEAGAYAGRNGATFLVLSDPDESDTGAAYPIFNFPTHIFIDEQGIIRSIVLEDMSTEQALREVGRILPAGS